jgi:spore coat protein JB
MNEKNMLMRNLAAISFSLLDLHLYLNTHPNDVNAIMLFNQYKQKYMVLSAEYERTYGPLTAMNGASDNTWKWIKDPWPWEYDANVGVR